jgi:hypothetical protein
LARPFSVKYRYSTPTDGSSPPRPGSSLVAAVTLKFQNAGPIVSPQIQNSFPAYGTATAVSCPSTCPSPSIAPRTGTGRPASTLSR